jgi:hypothetical protein
MFHPEVKIYATFYFAGGGGATRITARGGGSEGWHGADRVCVESIFSVPRSVADVEPQVTFEEQAQWTGLAASADPFAP